MPPRKRAASKPAGKTSSLRAVPDAPAEAAAEESVAPKTVEQAAADGTPRELLVALRTRIAQEVQNPRCPARDLASLSRRLLEISREIEQLDAEEKGDDVGNAAATPDEGFDAGAL